MKVAILTLPLGHNYGGVLQAYALQVVLRKLGCTPVTIDRRGGCDIAPHKEWAAWKLLRRARRSLRGRKQPTQYRHLRDFCARHIETSGEILSTRRLVRYINKHKFESIIVGSDQVWRPRYSKCIGNYFLDFCDRTPFCQKRISYAASFGEDHWEYGPDLTAVCKTSIRKFEAVSVREESGIRLSLEKLGVAAECHLDPTLLLEAEDYTALWNEGSNVEQGGTLVDYILDTTYEKELVKRRLQAKLGCGSKSILDHDSHVKHSGERGVEKLYPRVEDWITSFASAGFVFTDSYHGVIFSLLFHKPFVAFGNAKRGLARFNSLLNVFELRDRLVLSDGAVVEDIVDCPVEWKNVEKLRKEQIHQSISYLCDSLGIVARSNVHAPFQRLSG